MEEEDLNGPFPWSFIYFLLSQFDVYRGVDIIVIVGPPSTCKYFQCKSTSERRTTHIGLNLKKIILGAKTFALRVFIPLTQHWSYTPTFSFFPGKGQLSSGRASRCPTLLKAHNSHQGLFFVVTQLLTKEEKKRWLYRYIWSVCNNKFSCLIWRKRNFFLYI